MNTPNLLNACLLVLAVITAVGVIRLRNLFGATMLLGIYSLLMALVWTVMNAMDVAFTEAAVGAGISTILMIGALVHTGSKERSTWSANLPAVLAVAATGGLLLYGTVDMPALGSPDAPVHQRASRYYVSEASREATHAPNIVTAVLASYRGFDTLFETAVIFTAGAGMILLLRPARRRQDEDAASPTSEAAAPPPPPAKPLQPATQPLPAPEAAPRQDAADTASQRLVQQRAEQAQAQQLADQSILVKVTQILVPFIIMFGVYVITHGEIGPGGGFQGGVIVAAAYILCALVYGSQRARRFLPHRITEIGAAAGVLLYASVGLTTVLLGGYFLDYNLLSPDPHHPAIGQAIGMTTVELGVGLTVACVMVTVFGEMVEE